MLIQSFYEKDGGNVVELKIFNFIDETIKLLEEAKPEINDVSEEIEDYLKKHLESMNDGDINLVTRIKSKSSLEEKIIRNNYYKKYKCAEDLLHNLQDLIGIRVECRFIEDEVKIYEKLREVFNERDIDGYYYNSLNKNIRLYLAGEQPQKQKNGFEIYKIDGIYENDKVKYKFELQIKSLVNMFWGEIEHKVIYKNKNYMLGDEFLKNILTSIKKHLCMIDNQLAVVYNHSAKSNTADLDVRKKQIETMLSKIIYDSFSNQMKNSIGFIVDFKTSSDVIVNYIFRSSNAKDFQDYNQTLINMLSRVNEISKNNIDFGRELEFDRDINFESKFCEKFGNKLLNVINIDFHWNIFFKILFEIELGSNADDFERFIQYMEYRFYNKEGFCQLNDNFTKEESEYIKCEMLNIIANAFGKATSISFIYEKNICKINNVIEEMVFMLCKNIISFEKWEKEKDVYEQMILNKILLEVDE